MNVTGKESVMGILKNIIRNAVRDGVSKGVRDATRNMVSQALNPTVNKLANETADALDQSTGHSTSVQGSQNGQDGMQRLENYANKYADEKKMEEKRALEAEFSFPDISDVDTEDMKRFWELMKKYDGFEMVLGFRDWEDHHIGGKGGTLWYYVTNGSKTECYITSRTDGAWHDEYIIKKGSTKDGVQAKPGETIAMIASRAFFGQKKIFADIRTGMQVTNDGYPCTRYNFSFGSLSYDISDEYGVTVRYSDVDHAENGFSLRYINTGDDVNVPEF